MKFHRRLANWLARHAAEDRNSITITIAPAQAGRTFQLEVPQWSLRVVGVVLIVGFMLVVAGGILYGKLIHDALELRGIREENVQLRSRAERITQLEQQVSELDKVRRQLYAMAGVPDTAGVDRPQTAAEDSMSIVAEPAAGEATDLPETMGGPLRNLPFHGPVSRGFSTVRGRTPEHTGVDIAGPEGAPVAAAGSGLVTFSGWDNTYGNLLVIRHGDGWETRYGHNASLMVELGDSVRTGQTIALLGNTGKSSAPHLHFEIVRDGKTVDPGDYFKELRGGPRDNGSTRR